jgi:hypothetical protein
MKHASIRHRKPSEEGYMMVVVIFMLALIMISLSVAAPVIRKEIQRDRDVEMMHRGKQYARAVRLYYKRFTAYPPNVDALVQQNEIRFLRKKYIDLTTGKEDWKIIRLGQQKTQTLGFFGQPIGGSGVPIGGVPMGGAGLSGASPGSGSPIGGINSSGNTNFSLPSSPDAGTGANGQNPTAGATPSGSGSVDPNGGGSTTGSGTGTGSGMGFTGQTFGGAPIIGFSPNSPKQSILVYKKKNHYNEWEFFYDPIVDQMIQGGGNTGAIGQPVGTTPIGTPNFNGNSGAGLTNGGGNNGGSAPTPPPNNPPAPAPNPQQ